MSVVARRRLATGAPEGRKRTSGSCPRLPMRMTLLTPRAIWDSFNHECMCLQAGLQAGLQDGASGARLRARPGPLARSEEHTSELQSRPHLVCRLLLEKKKKQSR